MLSFIVTAAALLALFAAAYGFGGLATKALDLVFGRHAGEVAGAVGEVAWYAVVCGLLGNLFNRE